MRSSPAHRALVSGAFGEDAVRSPSLSLSLSLSLARQKLETLNPKSRLQFGMYG